LTDRTATAEFTVTEDDFPAHCHALNRWYDAIDARRNATRADWTDGARFYLYYVGPSTVTILLLVGWSWLTAGQVWPSNVSLLGLTGPELLPALALVIAVATWLSHLIQGRLPQSGNNSHARIVFEEVLGESLTLKMTQEGFTVEGPRSSGTYSWQTAFVFTDLWHGHVCLVHTEAILAVPVGAFDQPIKDIPDMVNDWCRQAKSAT